MSQWGETAVLHTSSLSLLSALKNPSLDQLQPIHLLSIRPSVCLSNCLYLLYIFIYIDVCMPTYVGIYLLLCPSVCLFISLSLSAHLSFSLCPSIYLPLPLSVILSISFSRRPSIYLSLSLSLSVYFSLYKSWRTFGIV